MTCAAVTDRPFEVPGLRVAHEMQDGVVDRDGSLRVFNGQIDVVKHPAHAVSPP